MVLLVFSALAIIFYSIFIANAIRGWKKMKPIAKRATDQLQLSIIIPCRNEKENLASLFFDLDSQAYSKSKYEVIFVDDHSTDGTKAELKRLQKVHSFTSMILPLEGVEGKKAALSAGIAASNNHYIITTDADCNLSKQWLQTFCNYFQADNVQFLAGPVRVYSDGSLFSGAQQFEFASLAGITASFFALGKPIMCNGANLGFTKEAFTMANGYDKHAGIASGDDVFLMHGLKKAKSAMRYIFEKEAIVETRPKKKLTSFVQQRIRWAGKSTAYKDADTIMVGALILGINILILSLLILSFLWSDVFLLLLLLIFCSKLLLDFLFVQKIKGFFGLNHVFLHSLLLSVLYPIYSCSIGLISFFVDAKWKR